MNELSIYIADDHAIVVDGLREILSSRPEWKITGTAGDGEEIVRLMSQHIADLVILDINMPKMNGIQCTRWIKKNHPQTRVIILTMFPERTYMDELIKAGADGCLLKSRGSKDLVDAVERVTTGKSYFDNIKDFNEPDERPDYHLSEREIEVIGLVVNGKTSAEIADQLFISEHTVKTHRKNIARKVGTSNTSELAIFAMNNRLLP